MARARQQRRRFGGDLRRVRRLSGLSGEALAQRIGITSSTLSRIENGLGRLLTAAEIAAWIRHTDATADDAERLHALHAAALNEMDTWRDAIAASPDLQDVASRMDRASRWHRRYAPTVIPGLLQTAEYARRVLTLGDVTGRQDVPAAVAGRMERQQILYESDRRFDFLVAAGALQWPLPAAAVAGQVDRLTSMDSLDNVTIGIIPTTAPATGIGWHQFVIYDDMIGDDDPFVYVELVHGDTRLFAQPDLAGYLTLYGRLAENALFGADAVALIRRIAAG